MTNWECTESTPHICGNSVYWTHETYILKGESWLDKIKKWWNPEYKYKVKVYK